MPGPAWALGRSLAATKVLRMIWEEPMRRIFALTVFASLLIGLTLWAQVQPPPAPWRGAGPTPCVGSDGGIYQCPPAPRPVVIRAGRLFDSKTGQMQTRQIVLLQGDKI